eukprot:SAG22_NODE_445_length_10447_cov_4.063104_8_plen_204_part_00
MTVFQNTKHLLSSFGHESVGFTFEDAYEEGPGGPSACEPTTLQKQRNLKVELFHKEGRTILHFAGPDSYSGRYSHPLDMNEYTRASQYQIQQVSVSNLRQACQEVYEDFGDYHEVSNNCQHYTAQLLSALKERWPDKIIIDCENFRALPAAGASDISLGESSPLCYLLGWTAPLGLGNQIAASLAKPQTGQAAALGRRWETPL